MIAAYMAELGADEEGLLATEYENQEMTELRDNMSAEMYQSN